MCIHRPGGFLEQYGVVPHLGELYPYHVRLVPGPQTQHTQHICERYILPCCRELPSVPLTSRLSISDVLHPALFF
ncbi:hypothetical protein PISMIDRAFT_675199 [Pisolithus microcarpus 441]|uniref:Uncharacterized protein n=1 Tax=Pisolithus microcarpus 441 TaxID=765257 RepID=A0A0C9YQG3_9AGAM|nr:hypothetical protein PISMIDRAFT_675199 [Pisolithus microcarpus 441]